MGKVIFFVFSFILASQYILNISLDKYQKHVKTNDNWRHGSWVNQPWVIVWVRANDLKGNITNTYSWILKKWLTLRYFFGEIIALLSQKTSLYFINLKNKPFNSIFLFNCSLNLTCKLHTKFFYGIRNPLSEEMTIKALRKKTCRQLFPEFLPGLVLLGCGLWLCPVPRENTPQHTHLVAGGEDKTSYSRGLSSSISPDPGFLISLAIPLLYFLIHDLASFLKSLF